MTEVTELLRHPFFQRYGVNLPSSLTEDRSLTLGEFPLPTCVGLRYGRSAFWREAFLGGLGAGDFRALAYARPCCHATCATDLPIAHTSDKEPILST